jgi:hypothetical protein
MEQIWNKLERKSEENRTRKTQENTVQNGETPERTVARL